MSKNSFQFKQFTVYQERCAMKVGTDGTLLGAWANAPEGPSSILDIGTGTGLVALMMAQRFPEATIHGIDIDTEAVAQATENVARSPFASRIMINRCDATKITDMEGYDAIVCNPPYFVDALTCPEAQRTMARHATTLNYKSLAKIAKKLLKPHAVLSVVIPVEYEENLESAVTFEGLFVSRVCQIKTTPNKLPKRLLMEIRKQPVDAIDFTEQVLEISPGIRSDWYHELTKDFYIK
jgi:tRNA1Val (adenine37-N6)-methyltransferase